PSFKRVRFLNEFKILIPTGLAIFSAPAASKFLADVHIMLWCSPGWQEKSLPSNRFHSSQTHSSAAPEDHWSRRQRTGLPCLNLYSPSKDCPWPTKQAPSVGQGRVGLAEYAHPQLQVLIALIAPGHDIDRPFRLRILVPVSLPDLRQFRA